MQHLALQLIGGNGSALPWRLTRGNEHWEGLPNGPLAANSPGLRREMAAHGLGIAGLDDRLAGPWVERDLLRRILPE